ncbi:MAG: hypothetical protein WCH85_10930 [Methanomicrobiales archaeon]
MTDDASIITIIVNLTPILVALIAVFGAAVPYLIQRNKESKLKIAEQKREVYARFLKNFTNISFEIMNDREIDGTDLDRERMLVRDQLVLYASDEVVKAYDTWIRYADLEKHDIDIESKLTNLILLAIRKDILGKSKVTPEQLAYLNSYNRG